jgi:hypothetical protein
LPLRRLALPTNNFQIVLAGKCRQVQHVVPAAIDVVHCEWCALVAPRASDALMEHIRCVLEQLATANEKEEAQATATPGGGGFEEWAAVAATDKKVLRPHGWV